MPPIQFVKKSTNVLSAKIETWIDLNILGHAQLEEREIGSRCGGHGICGGDRIQLMEGDPKLLSIITVEEKKHLSEEEIANGFRLACQCFSNDLHASFTFTHD